MSNRTAGLMRSGPIAVRWRIRCIRRRTLSDSNLGRALAHDEDYRAASQAFEDALLLSPSSAPPAAIHLEFGRVYSLLGYYTQARESLTRVSTVNKGGQYAAEAEKLMERLKPN